MLRFIIVIILVLLTGCASLRKDAGFEVETRKADSGGVEAPWHSIALRGDVSQVTGYTVAIIPLPVPLPEAWKNEIIDSARHYKVGNRTMMLRRSVWRTAFYGSAGIEVFDAVLNPSETSLFVLLPLGRVDEWKNGSWLVWFSDGRTVMTMKSVVIPVEGSVVGLSGQFFATNPSPFPRYTTFLRADPDGRKFFESLERRFPARLQMSDGQRYSTESEVVDVGALTKGDTAVDNLVTCGSATVVPSVTGVIVGVVLSLPHNLSVATNGCRNKKSETVMKKNEVTQAGLLLSSSFQTQRSTP